MTLTRAGKLRPSQATTQFGAGSLVDLPTLSLIVAGADSWNPRTAERVDEPRLARRLGWTPFGAPPSSCIRKGSAASPRTCSRASWCVPAAIAWPTIVRSPTSPSDRNTCRAATCEGQGKAVAYPARFMIACPKGHLADFPCIAGPMLRASTARASSACGTPARPAPSPTCGCTVTPMEPRRNVRPAFGEEGRKKLPKCTGERPWFRRSRPERVWGAGPHPAARRVERVLSVVESAISIPPWSDPVQAAVGQYIEELARVDTFEKLEMFLSVVNAPAIHEFKPEQIWEALQRRRGGVTLRLPTCALRSGASSKHGTTRSTIGPSSAPGGWTSRRSCDRLSGAWSSLSDFGRCAPSAASRASTPFPTSARWAKCRRSTPAWHRS